MQQPLTCRLKRKARHLAGQYTVVSLIMTFILVIIYTRFYPIMQEYIDDVSPTMDPMDATLISTVPFFVLLFVLWSALWYVLPHRQR